MPLIRDKNTQMSDQERRFRAWKSNISTSLTYLAHSTTPTHFFQDAFNLVTTDVGIMQEVILSLASEGGLRHVKQLCDTLLNVPEAQTTKLLIEKVIPFFQTITNSHVQASTLLDVAVGTILNFLYGLQGQRAVALFLKINSVLIPENLVGVFKVSDVEAAIGTFSSIIDTATHALVNDDLALVANQYFEFVSRLTLMILALAENLSTV